MNTNKQKKIALVIASEGFQQIEYNIPREILSNDGIKVITVSDKPTVAVAKDKSVVDVDITLDQVNPLDFDGFFLIGGPGALEHLDIPQVHDLLNQFLVLHKYIGAICIAPRILARAGVLNNKKATGWDHDQQLEKIFAQYGVTYVTDKPVVIDDHVITAVGPEAAEEFALAILHALTGL
jgi:protease I